MHAIGSTMAVRNVPSRRKAVGSTASRKVQRTPYSGWLRLYQRAARRGVPPPSCRLPLLAACASAVAEHVEAVGRGAGQHVGRRVPRHVQQLHGEVHAVDTVAHTLARHRRLPHAKAARLRLRATGTRIASE